MVPIKVFYICHFSNSFIVAVTYAIFLSDTLFYTIVVLNNTTLFLRPKGVVVTKILPLQSQDE